MITLQKLINVAPFPDESKGELLASIDNISDSKRFELEDLCWGFISQYYQNELRARQENFTFEIAKGNLATSSEDLAKIKDDLFDEIIRQFDVQEDRQDLAEVREKLANLD